MRGLDGLNLILFPLTSSHRGGNQLVEKVMLGKGELKPQSPSRVAYPSPLGVGVLCEWCEQRGWWENRISSALLTLVPLALFQ